MDKQPDISELHKKFEEISKNSLNVSPLERDKIKFPYEFFNSLEKGWIPCDILEVDTQKELAKVCFYNPDAVGWRETCQGGIYDEVVHMWRVRLRED
jgi:hypothetical protein